MHWISRKYARHDGSSSSCRTLSQSTVILSKGGRVAMIAVVALLRSQPSVAGRHGSRRAIASFAVGVVRSPVQSRATRLGGSRRDRGAVSHRAPLGVGNDLGQTAPGSGGSLHRAGIDAAVDVTLTARCGEAVLGCEPARPARTSRTATPGNTVALTTPVESRRHDLVESWRQARLTERERPALPRHHPQL